MHCWFVEIASPFSFLFLDKEYIGEAMRVRSHLRWMRLFGAFVVRFLRRLLMTVRATIHLQTFCAAEKSSNSPPSQLADLMAANVLASCHDR